MKIFTVRALNLLRLIIPQISMAKKYCGTEFSITDLDLGFYLMDYTRN